MPHTLSQIQMLYRELLKQANSLSSDRTKTLIIRISDGVDLTKLLKYGTDRANISGMPWKELPRLPHNPYGIIRHEDVIIASTFDDLERDVQLMEGTFKHKLDTITDPLIVAYWKKDFRELLSENAETNPQNHGRHFLFRILPKRAALAGVWLVHDGRGASKLERVR